MAIQTKLVDPNRAFGRIEVPRLIDLIVGAYNIRFEVNMDQVYALVDEFLAIPPLSHLKTHRTRIAEEIGDRCRRVRRNCTGG